MSNTVRKIHPALDHVVQETGRVIALLEDGSLRVRTSSGEHEAHRAVSCLVAAEVDDVVLLARTPDEGGFVLAVLRRESEAPTTVAVAGDLDVRVPGGRLTFAADEGVDIRSAREVEVISGKVRVTAGEGHVVLQGLSLISDAVRAEVDRIKLVGQSLDSVLERFSQRVQRSYRTITETDQVRARRIDYTAEKTASVHGEHAIVTADDLVKVDAEQIHLG